jgi:hypothetical protein
MVGLCTLAQARYVSVLDLALSNEHARAALLSTDYTDTDYNASRGSEPSHSA